MENEFESEGQGMVIFATLLFLGVSIYFVREGYFMLYGGNKEAEKKEKLDAEAKLKSDAGSKDKATTTTNDTLATTTVGTFVNGFEQYIVSTSKGNLNIRESADTSSKLLGSLKKDSPIVAKVSDTVGWSKYSKDGGATVFGYVSSQYLKKK